VGGDVAQHNTDSPIAEPVEGVEVTPNRVHGTADRGHLGVALHDGRGWKQLELEVVSQLELASHPLLAEILLHQAAVLDGGTDLVGDRRHQLEVARRKRLTAEPVGEVMTPTQRDPSPGTA
jgi:hypothetical protein